MDFSNKIIIFKNDAVGDLVQSLDTINNIINYNKTNKIILYLSERSKGFSFFFRFKNVEIKILNYDLTFLEKLKILINISFDNIKSIYILTPKNFYFFLPFLFRKIRFYGLCVNSHNDYKRPSIFFRKYLYKYVINDRSCIIRRPSTMDLQKKLTEDLNYDKKFEINDVPNFSIKELKKIDDYIYFHLKLSNFKKLGWGINELKVIFDEFLTYKKNVIFTRDIEKNNNYDFYKNDFNFIDFSNGKKEFCNSRIFLYDNIIGSDLYNLIKNAKKVVAFHGMMTNLASIEKKSVLDLFYCEINNKDDFKRYKNALYEFKPNYDGYDFIVPSKDIRKTLKKMRFSLNKL